MPFITWLEIRTHSGSRFLSKYKASLLRAGLASLLRWLSASGGVIAVAAGGDIHAALAL